MEANEFMESVRVAGGIDDADDGAADAGCGADVGVGCIFRQRSLVRSMTSAGSISAKAAEY